MSISHHDARFNAIQVAKELLLLEDHYAKVFCAECIFKHLLKIDAYCDEAKTLDNADKVQHLCKEAKDLVVRHLEWLKSNVGKPIPAEEFEKKRQEMLQEARQLRKKIFEEVAGVTTATEEIHDIRFD